MPLNLNIESPLTLFSGSITAHYVPNGTTLGKIMHVPTGSIPPIQNNGWQYIIKTDRFTTTGTAQATITDMTITLANNRRYLIIGHLSGASSATAQGFRVGVAAANLTTNIYSIEVPTSTTAIPTIGNNQTANALAAPQSNAFNYYMVKLTAIVTTAAAGVPTYAPTISTETAGNTAALGPSIIYYREY